jgi:hypothetical protein
MNNIDCKKNPRYLEEFIRNNWLNNKWGPKIEYDDVDSYAHLRILPVIDGRVNMTKEPEPLLQSYSFKTVGSHRF